MFTGIIEATGVIEAIMKEGSNLTLLVNSSLANELKVDQSVSHNGICLTVESIHNNIHTVTAIAETISKTNLGQLMAGDCINLERCMTMNGRIDGHIVQGHVDATGVCTHKKQLAGSWEFEFEFPDQFSHLVIEKGSICVNGVSLTAFNVGKTGFTVAIIPYTYQHTNFGALKPGTLVNLEFDIIGKYLARFKELA